MKDIYIKIRIQKQQKGISQSSPFHCQVKTLRLEPSLCDVFICTFRVEKYVSVDQGEFKDGSNPPRFEKCLKLLLTV
jgi:hypothetical protein